MAKVIESTDLESLESFRLAWTALAGHARIDGDVPSFATFREQWPAAANGRQLKVLSVESHGRVIGILPLAVDRRRVVWKSKRVVEFAIAPNLGATQLIGADVAASYLIAMRYLTQSHQEWDTIELGPFTSTTEKLRCQTAMRCTGIYRDQRRTNRDWLIGRC